MKNGKEGIVGSGVVTGRREKKEKPDNESFFSPCGPDVV